MTLEGVIEDIVYRNEENGYTVAVLSHSNIIDTVVGKFIDIKIGQSVRLDGEFVHNAKYGEQFSFNRCEVCQPSTKEGIEKYLSSGLIAGVGEVTAHRIVEEFGESALDIIEYSPIKLSTIRGISEKKAEAIGESFIEIKKLQNVVMFLQQYDITTNMSVKIFNVYGDKTVNLISKNPYKLVEDVDGIGFLSADRIAENMGVEKDSEFRIRAGMLHVIKEACDKSGHTYVLKYALIDNTAKLLAIDKDENFDKFLSVLQSLIMDRVVVSTKNNDSEIIALTKLYNTEKFVAKKLALLSASVEKQKFDITKEIEDFELFNKIKFHPDQIKAITSAINDGVCVITGGPGTGKTTIVKAIITILKQQRNRVLLVAPTGRASKRLSESTGEEAKTIHRALQLEFCSGDVTFKFNERCPLEYDAIIVDEFSMVDVNLAYSLLKAIKRDAKLIIVGDKDQLPSVGAGNVLADIISSGVIEVNYLTKIYRQEDNSLIISNAHLINNGEMPVLDNSSSDFFFEAKSDLEDIKETVKELASSRLPKFTKIDPYKIQVLAPLKAGICGVENLNVCLQDVINPSSLSKSEVVIGKTIFRQGDKVMQTSNNYDIEWKRLSGAIYEHGLGVFNGDIGTIYKIDYQTGETIVIFDDGREVVYTRLDLQELSLAYAITIHKSQGCEFDIVVMPVIAGASIILTRNLFYTAVTRAKKMVVLVGEKKNVAKMCHNTYTAKRFTLLKDMLIQQKKEVDNLYGE